MKKSFLIAGLLLLSTIMHAQEGMWMLNTLKQVNEADMQRLGFQLTAEDVYNVNGSSMKDAVARLGGGFCSGEIVSSEGLMLTNHHCGFEAIQSASSVEHDYLTDGFWAMTREQEQPAGFYVSFLDHIDNVTDKVNAELNASMTEAERMGKIEEMGGMLEKEAVGEKAHMSADFKTMYEGNEFYIFVYKDFPDVRMVGAPPSAIGKFGGDTDNWMWPRHTGDFSMFRVYTGPDGEPAEFAKENIPYKPKYWFPVSLDGVQQGDFSMVMGCPGSTDRFLSSEGVKLALDVEQPNRVKIRGKKLELMKQDMDASDAVRIQYAAKYAQVSNYWKYFIGQQRGLKRLRVFDKKKAQEADLMSWINADAGRKANYGEFLSLLEKGYAGRTKVEKASTYMQEAAFGSEVIVFGFRLRGLRAQLEEGPEGCSEDRRHGGRREGQRRWFLEGLQPGHGPEDHRRHVQDDPRRCGPRHAAGRDERGGEEVQGRLQRLGRRHVQDQHPHGPRTSRRLPGQAHAEGDGQGHGHAGHRSSCINFYRGVLGPAGDASQPDIDKGYRLMVAAMREREPNKMWYPNANSTIRASYGQVGDYKPGDAMHYDFVTTADGILEKEDNTNEEFVVPKRQHELLVARDYGRYADEKGELVDLLHQQERHHRWQ